MKALILVGGYGTRLRPLTINYPKSTFPFANKPMVQHQIQALANIGVVEVIIAINYQAHHIKSSLESLEEKYHIKITYSQETEALGTAGPLKLAQQILRKDNKEGLFFVFNSDIICDYPLEDLLAFHRQNKSQGTIVLAKVSEPSRYGVVVAEPDGKVVSFVEKPLYFISNRINAGIYLLNLSVLDKIPQRFCMIEKQTFPQLSSEGQLYSMQLKNDFWFDIGKPGDYIIGQSAYLSYYNIKFSKQFIGNVLVDESSKVEQNCKIGPNVVIGPNCLIKSGSRLRDCTIVGDTVVGQSCCIQNAIISWKCKIGNWVRIEGLSCLAQLVEVKEEVRLSECMVLSHRVVTSTTSKQILM